MCAIKVVLDETSDVPQDLWIFGEHYRSETWPKRNYATSDCVRHRVKPSCLTVTGLVIQASLSNTNVYEQGDKQNGIYRSGSPTNVFVSSIVKTVTKRSSDGSMSLKRAQAKVSDYNFGETLVEFNETLNLVSKRLGDFVKFVNNVRSGKWKQIGHKPSDKLKRAPASKRMADHYLELQFGWKPIISDIHDALEAFGNGLRTRGAKVHTRSGRKANYIKDGSSSWVDSANLEASASFRGVVQNERLAQLNQLGLLNPAKMAWEKLPFSFLVDWFWPISTVLGALTAGAGLRCVEPCVTTRSTTTAQLEVGSTIIINSQTYTAVRVRPVGAFITPRLEGPSPTIGKVITGAALARSILIK